MKGIAERRNGIQYFDVAQGYAHIELGKCILEYLQDVEIEQYTPDYFMYWNRPCHRRLSRSACRRTALKLQ